MSNSVKFQLQNLLSNHMKQNQIIVFLVAMVIAAGIGFWGGMTYQKNQTLTNFRNGNFVGRNGSFNGAPNGPNGMMANRRGGQVVGEVLSTDANSVTIKTADGSSKIILLTSTTSIVNSTVASTTDLKAGTKVAIFGNTNTDGSITAQNVQLNPIERFRPSGAPNQQ